MKKREKVESAADKAETAENNLAVVQKERDKLIAEKLRLRALLQEAQKSIIEKKAKIDKMAGELQGAETQFAEDLGSLQESVATKEALLRGKTAKCEALGDALEQVKRQ